MSNLPLGLAAAIAAVLVGAGCSSGRSPQFLPLPPPVVVEKTVSDKPRLVAKQQVTASARYVRVLGALPEAKGALAFLADEAGLRKGTVTLSKEQADAALAELTRLTGAEVRFTPGASVADGNPAKMGIGLERSVWMKEVYGASVTEGGSRLAKNSEIMTELMVFPQVAADGSIQLEATVQSTTFAGFFEYTGDVSIAGDVAVKVPPGFYQPVFAESSVTAQVRMRSGATIVLRGDGKKTFTSWDNTIVPAPKGNPSLAETLLVFLTAAVKPAKR